MRIIKVGGSLLEYEALPTALQQWLSQQPATQSQPWANVLLAGGGRLADEIRRADNRFGLGEETAHWLCVDVLGVTARLLAKLTPQAPLVSHRGNCAAQGTVVLDPIHFLQEEERNAPGTPLPHTWSVTTDSIAARLAEIWRADELVLLKSSDPPAYGALEDLARAGFVDAYFPRAAAPLSKIRLVFQSLL